MFPCFTHSHSDPSFPTVMYGTYAEHIKEAWEKRNHPNLHFAFYEDMKADVMGELKRLDDFMETKLTPKQLDTVAHHTSFKEMKGREDMALGKKATQTGFNNEITKKEGGFFRKGERERERKKKENVWLA